MAPASPTGHAVSEIRRNARARGDGKSRTYKNQYRRYVVFDFFFLIFPPNAAAAADTYDGMCVCVCSTIIMRIDGYDLRS